MTNIDYKKVVVQWRENPIPKAKFRSVNIDLSSDFIWAIIGPRRAGKTYVCFQLMYDLIAKGTPEDNIFYVNFEDEKILNAEAKDIQGILDALYELYPPKSTAHLYLFLDEIQNVRHWQKWTRRIQETKKNIKLIVTGSSAKLLSKELSTELRGRVLVKEILPLSFKEFLNWKDQSFNIKTIAYSHQKEAIKKYFDLYLQNGGYPAVFLNVPALRDQILQQYFDNMLLNDVVERYKIKDVKKLRILAGTLFESVGRDFSFSKTAVRLKNAGYELGKNTIVSHVHHFEDAYLFFQNIKYEYSLSKQLGSIKKIYCIDNGLLNAVSFKFSDDIGRLLENLVYVELKRRGGSIYYSKDKFECDFVVSEKNKIISAVQVTSLLSEENEHREVGGLAEAMEKFKLKQGIILTLEQKETRKIAQGKIEIVPVWEWLLRSAHLK